MGSAGRSRSTWRRPVAGVALVALLAGACGPTETAPTPVAQGSLTAPATAPAVSAATSSSPSAAPPPAPTPTATIVATTPLAAGGAIALLGTDGSLTVVDAQGRSTPLAPAGDGGFTFPAWSPDGAALAAIHYGGTANELLVYPDAARAATRTPEPTLLLQSSTIGPFYLSWSPDGRTVSYLANEGDGLALRLAPADGSAPTDGSGAGARVKTGGPFYYDWIERDRLLAHIGTGPEALLGEFGLDGEPVTAGFASPGTFRSAVISPSHRFVSYVHTADGASTVVLADRDGSDPHTMPVFGPAAMTFSPTDDLLASIGSEHPVDESLVIPVGPLRLLDPASSEPRTLLNGAVVSFWWSPDGRTIAALRVQRVGEAASGASASPSPSPAPAASPAEPENEVRLLFVDVETGAARTQTVVRPAQLFIDQILPYFDQYALSHELWSPDSAAFLLPIVDDADETRVAVVHRDGSPAVLLDGAVGFWSPAAP